MARILANKLLIVVHILKKFLEDFKFKDCDFQYSIYEVWCFLGK